MSEETYEVTSCLQSASTSETICLVQPERKTLICRQRFHLTVSCKAVLIPNSMVTLSGVLNAF